MKNLLKLRAAGKEPELVAVNLTGKPATYPGAYIAEPDGSIKSLYAAHVVFLVDEESLIRGVEALDRIKRLGVASFGLAYLDSDRWIAWRDAGNGSEWFDVPFEEKRIGIYTETRLRELAGDDWEELKSSPEMLNTFAYLCQANMEAA